MTSTPRRRTVLKLKQKRQNSQKRIQTWTRMMRASLTDQSSVRKVGLQPRHPSRPTWRHNFVEGLSPDEFYLGFFKLKKNWLLPIQTSAVISFFSVQSEDTQGKKSRLSKNFDFAKSEKAQTWFDNVLCWHWIVKNVSWQFCFKTDWDWLPRLKK